MSTNDSLPDDVETLKWLLLASNAELAQARAEATSAEALVVHLRLMIEKLKRDLSPGRGSRDDGTSHLLVLQQLDVQISFGRPRRAGDVAQPCGGEVERGLTVRERTHDTRAPPDLARMRSSGLLAVSGAVTPHS